MKLVVPGALNSIFRWPARRQAELLFPLLLLASIALHLLGSLLFDIQYPDPAPPERPAVTLQLAPPGSALADLLAPAQGPETDGPAQTLLASAGRYHSQLENRAAELQPLPASPTRPKMPSHRDPGPVRIRSIPGRKPIGRPVTLSGPAPVGGVFFSPALQSRASLSPNPPPPTPEQAAGLPPVTFRVAVGPDGTLLHGFLQESSGDGTVDRAAGEWLRSQHFARSDSTTWGTARCVWDPPAK